MVAPWGGSKAMRTVIVSSGGMRKARLRAAARTALLAGLACICMAAWAATPESDHAVGTLARVDTGQSRIVLSRDSETGNVVGQGTPDNIYLSPSTVITRSGSPVKMTDLKVGERLLVATQSNRNRTEGTRVRVLPSTSPGQDWGRYLHGTLRSIEKANPQRSYRPGRDAELRPDPLRRQHPGLRRRRQNHPVEFAQARR